jgi:hypothetical protein
MRDPLRESSLFVVPSVEGASLLGAVESALAGHAQALASLPTLTNVAVGDPYLARQLAELHARHELRPPPARGLLARLRTRLAWWLLGPELRQASEVNATLVRALDSLVVQLDQDRAARRRLEEQLAYQQERS